LDFGLEFWFPFCFFLRRRRRTHGPALGAARRAGWSSASGVSGVLRSSRRGGATTGRARGPTGRVVHEAGSAGEPSRAGSGRLCSGTRAPGAAALDNQSRPSAAAATRAALAGARPRAGASGHLHAQQVCDSCAGVCVDSCLICRRRRSSPQGAQPARGGTHPAAACLISALVPRACIDGAWSKQQARQVISALAWSLSAAARQPPPRHMKQSRPTTRTTYSMECRTRTAGWCTT